MCPNLQSGLAFCEGPRWQPRWPRAWVVSWVSLRPVSSEHLDSTTVLWLDEQGPGTAQEVGSTAPDFGAKLNEQAR